MIKSTLQGIVLNLRHSWKCDNCQFENTELLSPLTQQIIRSCAQCGCAHNIQVDMSTTQKEKMIKKLGSIILETLNPGFLK